MEFSLLDSKILCSETLSNMPHILSFSADIGKSLKAVRLYGKKRLTVKEEGRGRWGRTIHLSITCHEEVQRPTGKSLL